MAKLITTADIAAELGVAVTTVRRWARKNPSFRALAKRVGRRYYWDEQAVHDWYGSTNAGA